MIRNLQDGGTSIYVDGANRSEGWGGGCYPAGTRGVSDEDGEVDGLKDEAGAVDGDDEEAVGVDEGHTVEDPHHAVEQGGQVGDGGEVLHCLLPPYLAEGGPASHTSENGAFRFSLSE